MTIKDVLALETGNIDKIYLIKEGFFWRAYERSSYRFVKHIRNYQVMKRHIKKVKQDICYLGFPENMLDTILKLQEKENFVIEHKTKAQIIIRIKGIEEDIDFEQWKESIALPVAKENSDIIRKIKNYPVFKKTPLEVMQFVAELQEKMKFL